MNESKIICEKDEFIDEIFGEKIEYVRIYEDNGITIIFGLDNQIIVKKFKNTKELIEKFIEKYIECEFSDSIWQEQDEELTELCEENVFLRECLEQILKCIADESKKITNKFKKQEE